MYFYSSSCAFESITLSSDFQSVLRTLSTPFPYLIPTSLTDTQFFLNSLFESEAFHLKWIFGYSSLPGDNLADSLAKIDATHDSSTIPLSILSLISYQRLSLYTRWRCNIQSGFFQHQISSVSEEVTFLARSLCFL